MFFKAASHPAVPREITEDLILSGRDTILLVVFFFLLPRDMELVKSRLPDCWGTILRGSRG